MEQGSARESVLQFVRNGDFNESLLLIEQMPALAETRSEHGSTLVQLAYYFGYLDLALEIAGRIPVLDLHSACVLGDVDRVAAALDSSPDAINTQSEDEGTALCFACFFGHEAVVKLLIERGADVNLHSHGFGGVAPIHSAAANNSFPIVQLLVVSGADVNAQQHGGFRPLHAAAQNGNMDICKFLIENGADVNVLTDEGMSAAQLALDGGNLAVHEMLSNLASL